MVDDKGKIRCDREIGRIKHWHGCNALAVAVVDGFDGITLHYCAAHVDVAISEGRKLRHTLPTPTADIPLFHPGWRR